MSKTAKQLSAAEVAAAGADTLTVPWRDLTFTVPKMERWSIDAFEALEENKIVVAMREVLGPEQWQTFKASDPKPTQADAIAIANLISEAAANVPSVGESSASSDS